MLLTILVSKKKINKGNKDTKKDTKRKFTGLWKYLHIQTYPQDNIPKKI